MKAPAGYDNDLGTASLCKELSSTYASFPSISFSSWWILRPCSHAWLRTDARSTNDVDCFYYFKHWPGCRNCFAMETISNLSFVLHEHRAGCRLPPALLLSRRNQSPDAVRSRNPSKSTLAHDAVAAAVSHKHHSIIRVDAGLIQFVYGSNSQRGNGAHFIKKTIFSRFRLSCKRSLILRYRNRCLTVACYEVEQVRASVTVLGAQIIRLCRLFTSASFTPVAELFFEAENRTNFPLANLLEPDLDKSQIQFTSELLVPEQWIHKSTTAIVSQQMFLSNIWTALFEQAILKAKPPLKISGFSFISGA